MLEDVEPGSPAANAGLKGGDVITNIEGNQVDNVQAFAANIFRHKVGSEVDIRMVRHGVERSIRIKLAETDYTLDRPTRFSSVTTTRENIVDRFGIDAVTIDDTLRRALGVLRIPEGVLVVAHTADSIDRGKELMPGDVIHSVNNNSVISLPQLKECLRSIKPGDPIVLNTERSGSLRYVDMGGTIGHSVMEDKK